MKNILKNKQYQFLALLVTIILVSSFVVNKTKRVTYISNDLKVIQKQILDWTNLGYEIEFVIPQSISETVKFDSRHGSSNDGSYKMSKGDILLVMKK
jgi:hypothetical protein